MAYDNNEKRMDSVYSKRIRAGKRRTYFFDVRTTRGNDYYLTITESRKRFNDDGYDRHKIFLYKEDFNKFIKALGEAVDHVKTELMPDFDFDAFNHDTPYEGDDTQVSHAEPGTMETIVADLTETPIEKIEAKNIAEEIAENTETTTEKNDGPAENGSAEVAEKW